MELLKKVPWALALISVVVFVGWGVVLLQGRIDDVCMYSRKDSLGGRIHRSSGFLRGSMVDFKIRYAGKRKNSGDECEAVVSVTEREYERIVYANGSP